MLSILIPIYNQKVEKLVKALMRQCNRLHIDYEILCFDDGSKKRIKYENSILSDYFGVNYTELSENLGRARIRNWMAKSASYDNLLFLDCDSKVISKYFIGTYMGFIEDYDVISGGRTYSNKPPRAKSKHLHWLYGSRLESVKLSRRRQSPELYFHSNNFMVRRSIMIDTPFDENIKQYGYEDLLWARQIANKGFRILHIDNSIEHLGLERKDVFIKKTEKSISNLIDLQKTEDKFETRLTRFADKLQNLGLKEHVYSYLKKRSESIRNRLHGDKPSLRHLQMYKLYLYWQLKNKL